MIEEQSLAVLVDRLRSTLDRCEHDLALVGHCYNELLIANQRLAFIVSYLDSDPRIKAFIDGQRRSRSDE